MAVRTWAALGLCAAAVLYGAAGCNGGGKSYAVNDQVEGTVTLDGAPLANVFVQFVPDIDPKYQAPPAAGITDAKGRFTLAFDDQRPGAVVGKNYVVVRAGRGGTGDDREGGGRPAAKPVVPEVYGLAAKTPLAVAVTAEQHTYELKLSRNAGPRSPK
jgi:hypothetical protein